MSKTLMTRAWRSSVYETRQSPTRMRNPFGTPDPFAPNNNLRALKAPWRAQPPREPTFLSSIKLTISRCTVQLVEVGHKSRNVARIAGTGWTTIQL
jgi:hypothetical protein